ncbi:MAG: anthranilate phosphoribosyltransferase, partial [Phycisphaeraceae bacterium]|nr:anthranilate phosphoribosyltransferase [Phycisphaeraceae bacterium]
MPEDTASLTDLLQRLSEGQAASHDDIVAAFQTVMAGEADPAQTGALLGMLAMKGVDRDQLTAAATVMRDNATRVEAPDHLTLVDTCGTGGDHAGTFNISTAAALVTAGAGREHDIAVAKHGNRSVTSNSGSSQVLEALGVTLTAPPAVLRRCLAEAGICFCFAPAHHPAMKHVVPVRKALGFRTLFNVVGPLTNPAGARRQMLGVFDPELTTLMAEVLKDLGAERAMVVHGAGGLD